MAEKAVKVRRLLHDCLLQHGGSVARERVALIAAGESHTFGQLLDSSLRLAGALRDRGVGQGDRVAIHLEKSWACVTAIPGTEVYLLSDDRKPVRPGEAGILYVRGPHVMAGYWNRPDLTDRMLKPGKLRGERVLCTHDLFRMDEDGFLYFVGRTDDIIKTRGEKVSPVEAENALHRIPRVREAAVVGVPDPLLGEAVRAYVVTDPQAGLTAQSLRAGSTAYLVVPTQVILCDDLPRNANGKIAKRLLTEDPISASAADTTLAR